jgi:alpha-ribazole phosphatase
MDLVLIRHPQVAIDAGICYGQTDVPLLHNVNESARVITTRMKALGVPSCVDGWHTSPLQRCASLARVLSAKPKIDPRLSELDFGAWEGKAWDSIDRAVFDKWAADLEHSRVHGGESLAQFAARVLDWLSEVSADSVHVVAHAGVMRVLAAHLLKIDREAALNWSLDFGGIAWFRRAHGKWLVVRWNA